MRDRQAATNQVQVSIDIYLILQTVCVQKSKRQATPVTLANVTVHRTPQHPRFRAGMIRPVLSLKREKFACGQLNARLFALII